MSYSAIHEKKKKHRARRRGSDAGSTRSTVSGTHTLASTVPSAPASSASDIAISTPTKQYKQQHLLTASDALECSSVTLTATSEQHIEARRAAPSFVNDAPDLHEDLEKDFLAETTSSLLYHGETEHTFSGAVLHSYGPSYDDFNTKLEVEDDHISDLSLDGDEQMLEVEVEEMDQPRSHTANFYSDLQDLEWSQRQGGTNATHYITPEETARRAHLAAMAEKEERRLPMDFTVEVEVKQNVVPMEQYTNHALPTPQTEPQRNVHDTPSPTEHRFHDAASYSLSPDGFRSANSGTPPSTRPSVRFASPISWEESERGQAREREEARRLSSAPSARVTSVQRMEGVNSTTLPSRQGNHALCAHRHRSSSPFADARMQVASDAADDYITDRILASMGASPSVAPEYVMPTMSSSPAGFGSYSAMYDGASLVDPRLTTLPAVCGPGGGGGGTQVRVVTNAAPGYRSGSAVTVLSELTSVQKGAEVVEVVEQKTAQQQTQQRSWLVEISEY